MKTTVLVELDLKNKEHNQFYVKYVQELLLAAQPELKAHPLQAVCDQSWLDAAAPPPAPTPARDIRELKERLKATTQKVEGLPEGVGRDHRSGLYTAFRKQCGHTLRNIEKLETAKWMVTDDPNIVCFFCTPKDSGAAKALKKKKK